jgi:hypothetical protein
LLGVVAPKGLNYNWAPRGKLTPVNVCGFMVTQGHAPYYCTVQIQQFNTQGYLGGMKNRPKVVLKYSICLDKDIAVFTN